MLDWKILESRATWIVDSEIQIVEAGGLSWLARRNRPHAHPPDLTAIHVITSPII